VPGTCPGRARHLSWTRLDASNLRPGREPGARHLPGRGWMLAICGRAGTRCQAPARTRRRC
jgi:hypothetical protein